MKIFNWVHRRFSHKDGKSAEKSSLAIDGGNKSALSNVFLTIGTLGYDQLKELQSDDVLLYEQDQPEKDQPVNNYIETDDDDEQQIVDSGEEEEVNPLVHAACNAHDYRGFGESDETVLKNVEKVRTTLAELFSADSELHEKQEMNKHKSPHYRKSRLSLAKKLIGEDAHRPIHKLQRVMRRMLKRKVYPEPFINSVANKCHCSICFTFPNSRCKHLMPTE